MIYQIMKQIISDYSKLFEIIHGEWNSLKKERMLVLIGGCSRVGKTTLAQKIQKDFNITGIGCLIVSLDNWIVSIEKRRGDETVRERYKYEEIINAAKNIMCGVLEYAPIYDSKTRRVVYEKSSAPLYLKHGIIVLEGVVALDIPGLRRFSDIRIYLKIEKHVITKRLKEFYIKYKKLSLKETEMIIRSRNLDEIPFIEETKKYANIIYCPKSQSKGILRTANEKN